jgi:hypothetical protein
MVQRLDPFDPWRDDLDAALVAANDIVRFSGYLALAVGVVPDVPMRVERTKSASGALSIGSEDRFVEGRDNFAHPAHPMTLLDQE